MPESGVPPADIKASVLDELLRVEQDAGAYRAFHAGRAGTGRVSRYVFGLLAAAAGTTALAEASPSVTALLAFASPVVAALHQLARPDKRAGEHHRLRTGYEDLKRRVRLSREVEFPSLEPNDAVQRLTRFIAELDVLLRETPDDLAVPGPRSRFAPPRLLRAVSREGGAGDVPSFEDHAPTHH